MRKKQRNIKNVIVIKQNHAHASNQNNLSLSERMLKSRTKAQKMATLTSWSKEQDKVLLEISQKINKASLDKNEVMMGEALLALNDFRRQTIPAFINITNHLLEFQE